MPENNINILVADDNPNFLEGLCLLLGMNMNYNIVGKAENGKELVEHPELGLADLILSDIEMPVMNGIEAAKQINYMYPNKKMIAITMYRDKVYLYDLISAGFKGFIYKPEISETLHTIIDNVLNDKIQYPSDLE